MIGRSASDHSVFSSRRAALRASDYLRDGAKYRAIVTALLPPNGGESVAAAAAKFKGMGLRLESYCATGSVLQFLNVAWHIVVPTKPIITVSFRAMLRSLLLQRNVTVSGFNSVIARVLDVGFISVGVGSGWVRVEAGVCYPADVFAGVDFSLSGVSV